MYKLKLGIGIFILMLSGCAFFTEYGRLERNARQAYENAKYDEAVFAAVKSLKIKPEYDKSQDLLKTVFPLAVDSHLNKIKNTNAGNGKFKWDAVVTEYDALIQINQGVKALSTLTNKETKEVITFTITDYSQELSDAKKNAAEAHYKEGVSLAKGNGADVQKQAAKEFKAAENYMPGYKDAASLYEKARKAGVKRIAIIPFEDKSGKGKQYGAVADTVVDDIVSNIMGDSSATEFLEIITRDQLQNVMAEQKLGMSGIVDEKTAVQIGKILGVHEILTGKITQITVTPERTTNKNIRETGEVCDYSTKPSQSHF